MTSLALFFDLRRTHGTAYDDRLARLDIGLEHVDEVAAGLDQAFYGAGFGGASH